MISSTGSGLRAHIVFHFPVLTIYQSVTDFAQDLYHVEFLYTKISKNSLDHQALRIAK